MALAELCSNFKSTFDSRRLEIPIGEFCAQEQATRTLLKVLSTKFNPIDNEEDFEESWTLRSSYFKHGQFFLRIDKNHQYFRESGRENDVVLSPTFTLEIHFIKDDERRPVFSVTTEILTARKIPGSQVIHLSRYSPEDLCLIAQTLACSEQISKKDYCMARDGKYYLNLEDDK